MMLSDVWRLSVTYIGNNSTERPRKTKIGTQVAHVTRELDTAFEVKRSKVNLQGRGNIVADSCTSLIFINSLIFMAPTAIGSKAHWAPRAYGMGCSWAAASSVRPAGAYCVATRTACCLYFHFVAVAFPYVDNLRQHIDTLIFQQSSVGQQMVGRSWIHPHENSTGFLFAQCYKTAVSSLIFKCLHRMAPVYLTVMNINPVSASASRSHLRSAARGDLAVPRSRTTTYGQWSLSVSGPSLWNSLPLSVRDPSLTMTQFCTHLKTFLFRRAYCT